MIQHVVSRWHPQLVLSRFNQASRIDGLMCLWLLSSSVSVGQRRPQTHPSITWVSIPRSIFLEKIIIRAICGYYRQAGGSVSSL